MAISGACYVTHIMVRFAHCDPAGIVFYPRYFEMFNSLIEDWCAEGLGTSFRELIIERELGLPTVRFETDFIAPSELGEKLQACLQVTELGGSSIVLAVRLLGPDGKERVRSRQVLVLIDRRSGRAIPIPDELRERISRFYVTQ
jgi:4-hydroxybenzoyl-CoA thioesterase